MTAQTFEIESIGEAIPCDDGFQMPAVLITPRLRELRPGLLFIGEPFGFNSEMRRIASEIASAGYVVLAPNLLSRGPWFRCVRALMQSLKQERGQGIDDLLTARRWLGGHAAVQPDRIAVMGLCMGGGFALILAKTGLFRVSAPFYGQTPQSMDGSCPVVASFGARDQMIRPHAERLEAELTRIGVPHDVKHYAHAGHSFLTRPPNKLMALIGPYLPPHAGHEPQAAADAMRRVLAFLERHL
jgi:carboxymethylenebutenolidase